MKPNWPSWNPQLHVEARHDGVWIEIPAGRSSPEWLRAWELWTHLDDEQRLAALRDDVCLSEVRKSLKNAETRP